MVEQAIPVPDSQRIQERLTLQLLVFEMPLYAPRQLATSDVADMKFLLSILYDTIQADGFCIHCKRESHFRRYRSSHTGLNYEQRLDKITHNGRLVPISESIRLECARDNSHVIDVEIRVVNGLLQKYGQFPSLSDLTMPELSKYRKVLGEARYSELRRGIGLFSHGANIGAFIYMRRVFELLIEAHHAQHVVLFGEVEGYGRMHVAERVKTLSNTLPAFRVDNVKLYSILSRGVHELSEEACGAAFPAVRAAILLILDQDLRRVEQQKNEEEVRKALQAL